MIHDITEVTPKHHLEVILVEDVAVIFGYLVSKTFMPTIASIQQEMTEYCLPRFPMKS